MDRGIGPRSSMMCAKWSSSRE